MYMGQDCLLGQTRPVPVCVCVCVCVCACVSGIAPKDAFILFSQVNSTIYMQIRDVSKNVVEILIPSKL